jgi:hypothetical protein
MDVDAKTPPLSVPPFAERLTAQRSGRGGKVGDEVSRRVALVGRAGPRARKGRRVDRFVTPSWPSV